MKPNVIRIELDNGTVIEAPTEAWILGILDFMSKVGHGAFEHVINYMKANESKPGDPPDLHTPDGRRVHMMKNDLQ